MDGLRIDTQEKIKQKKKALLKEPKKLRER